MLPPIFKWLSENYPLVFLVIVLIGLTIYITTVVNKLLTRFKKVEKTCDSKIPELQSKLEIGVNLSGVIENKIDNHFETTKELNTKLLALSKNINVLVTFLTVKHTDLQSGLFQSFSPIQLTELGLEILNTSGGKSYIESHLDALLKEMENQEFKSALDVQSFATSLILKEFDSDDFIHIRNYIFQNPVYRPEGKSDIAINSPVMNQIIGIYLRDKYFEKHPELKDKD